MRKLHVWVFHARTHHRVETEQDAADIAYSTIGGKILHTISYPDLRNKHALLAVAACTHGNASPYHVHLLEQFGTTYRPVWKSEGLFGWASVLDHFRIHDIDHDGIHELSFASIGCGSGGGSASLYLYVPALTKLFELRMSFDWQDHSTPPQPVISLLPDEPAGRPIYHDALEKRAAESNFLNMVETPDFDHPSWAHYRWHKENGELRTGAIARHFYNGPPAMPNSTTATLEEEGVAWIAYFKGPVVAHLKTEDAHYVVYCPSSTYHWPTCLLRDRQYLLIGTRGDGIIRFNIPRLYLDQIIPCHEGSPIREINTIETEGNTYVVNGATHLPRSKPASS